MKCRERAYKNKFSRHRFQFESAPFTGKGMRIDWKVRHK